MARISSLSFLFYTGYVGVVTGSYTVNEVRRWRVSGVRFSGGGMVALVGRLVGSVRWEEGALYCDEW